MKPVDRGEILGLAEYEAVRERFRARVIAEKKLRRVQLGPKATAVFENHDTMLMQIQEMLRTERITRPAAVQHEIDTYNEIVPGTGRALVHGDDRDRRQGRARRVPAGGARLREARLARGRRRARPGAARSTAGRRRTGRRRCTTSSSRCRRPCAVALRSGRRRSRSSSRWIIPRTRRAPFSRERRWPRSRKTCSPSQAGSRPKTPLLRRQLHAGAFASSDVGGGSSRKLFDRSMPRAWRLRT